MFSTQDQNNFTALASTMNQQYLKHHYEIISNIQAKRKEHYTKSDLLAPVFSRELAPDEFEGLNEFLRTMSFKTIGDTFYIKDYTPPISPIQIVISDMECQDILLQDVLYEFRINASNRKMEHSVETKGFQGSCILGFRVESWDASVIGGRLSVSLIDTNMKVSVEMASKDFQTSPPTSARGGTCELDLAIDDINLQGFAGITNPIIKLLTNNLPQMLKNRFEADFCCEFNAFMEQNVTKVLQDMDQMLSPYINDEISNEDVNEFDPQENLISTGHNFLDFTDSDGSALGVLVQNITNDLNENLGGDRLGIDDSINTYIRNMFLDESGGFSITQRDIQSYNNGVVFSTQDHALNMELYLDSIVVSGLDTFMTLHLMQGIAPQTLQTSMKLRNLAVEASATAKLYNTDDENDDLSVYFKFAEPQTIDNIQFEASFDNIDLDLTTLVAIDLNQISEDLKVNQLLNVSCFSSFLSAFEIARLDLSLDMPQDPNLSNLFQSDELDGVVNSMISSQLNMYESAFFNRAMTNYISTRLREDMNEKIREVMSITSNRDCPPIKTTGENEFIDFRDLLLNRSLATEYGASGEEPYGNIVPIAIRIFEDAFLKPTMMGGEVPWINVVLVAPMTKLLSGKSGHINLIDLAEVFKSGFTTTCAFNTTFGENTFDYGFSIKKAEVYNLDSFGYPVNFLTPKENDPHRLSSVMTLGAVDGLPLKFVSQIELFINSVKMADSEEHSAILDTLATFSRVNFEIDLEITKMSIVSEIMAKVKESEFLNFSLKNARNPYCILSTLIPVLEEDEKALSIFVRELTFEQIDLDVRCHNCTSSTLTSELPKIMSILRNEGLIQMLVKNNIDFIVEFVNGQNVQNTIDKLILESREKCFEESEVTTLIKNESMCKDISLSLPTIDNIYSLESVFYTAAILFQIGLVVIPISIVGEGQEQAIVQNDVMRLEEEFHSNGELGGVVDLSSDKSTSLLGYSLNRLLKTINYMVGSGFMNVYNVEDILSEILTTSENQLIHSTTSVSHGSRTVDSEDVFINSIMAGLSSDGDEEIFLDLSENELIFDLNDLGLTSFSSDQSIRLQLQSIRIRGVDSFSIFEPYILVGGQTFMSKFTLNNLALEFEFDLHVTSSNDEMQKDSVRLGMELENIVLDIGTFLALREEILSKIPLKLLLSTDTLLDCLIPSLQHVEIVHLDFSAILKDMTIDGGLITSDDIKESVRKTFHSIMNVYQSQLQDAFHIISQKFLREEINSYIQTILLPSIRESTDFGNCYFDNTSENVFIDWHLLFKEIPTPKQEVFPYGDIIPQALFILREYLLQPSMSGKNKGSPKINNYIPEEYVIPGDVFYYEQDLNFSVMSESPYLFYGNVTNLRLNNINSFDFPISLLRTDLNNQYLVQNEFILGKASRPLQLDFQLEVGVINGTNGYIKTRSLPEKEDNGNNYDIHDIIDIFIEIEGLQLSADFHVQMNENDLMSMDFVKSLYPMCLLSAIPIPEDSNDGLTLSASLDLQYSSMKFQAKCVTCSSPDLQHMNEIFDLKEVQNVINEKGGEFLKALNPSLDKVADVLLNLLLSTAKPLCAITTLNMDELDFSQLDFDAIDMDQIDAEDLDSFDLTNIDPSAVDQQKLLSSFMESSPIKLPSVAFVNDSIYYVIALSLMAVIILLSVTHFIKRQKVKAKKRQIDMLSACGEEELFNVFLDQIIKDSKAKKLNDCNISMLLNEEISIITRYGVVCLLAINTVTFFLAHTMIDARVDVIGVFAGQEILLKNMFEFAIGETLFQAYNNGARFVAAYVIFCSLFWPYIKIIITLVCFSCPPSKMSIQTRGKILHLLNYLNKWSMTDVFALIIRSLIFDQQFVSPDLLVDGEVISLSGFGDDNTEEKLYDIQMSYILYAGIYLNLLSQVIMQISSEIIVSNHEKILRDEMSRINQGVSDLLQQDDNVPETMSCRSSSEQTTKGESKQVEKRTEGIRYDTSNSCSTDTCSCAKSYSNETNVESPIYIDPPFRHIFKPEYCKSTHSMEQGVVLKKSTYFFVLFCCALAIFTLFLGFYLPSFTLEIFGVASYILIAGKEDSDTTLVPYNIFQIIQYILGLQSDNASVMSKAGLILVVSMVIIPCLIAPLAQIGALVTLWSARLRKKHRNLLIKSLEFWSSWQYIDVFVVTTFMFMWQGDEFVEYGIDIYCEKFRNIVFPIAVYSGILDQPNARCFVLNITIQSGLYFLIATSLLLSFITNILTKALKQQDKDLTDRHNTESENVEDTKELNRIIVSMGGVDESAIDDILHNLGEKPLSFTETFPFFFSSSNSTNIDSIETDSIILESINLQSIEENQYQ